MLYSMRASESLKQIVDSESLRLHESFEGQSYYGIQSIIRRFDVINLTYLSFGSEKDKQAQETYSLFAFGFPRLLKLLYAKLDLSPVYPFFEFDDLQRDWADSAIIFAGKLGFCQQILDYEKAGLLEIVETKKGEYTFAYSGQRLGDEYFDNLSMNFLRNRVISQFILNKRSTHPVEREEIVSKLRGLISNPYGRFISYTSTPEIDEYYEKQGYYHLVYLQGYDHFDETDNFGGISYSIYLDYLQSIIGVGIKHVDACMELIKTNPTVDIHNLISYTWSTQKTIDADAKYFGITREEMELIISCFTISPSNYSSYLSLPAASPPIYCQLSNTQHVRLSSGCLCNPVTILRHELKSRFKLDYDIAVTKREQRFKRELYSLFPDDRMIKVEREIRIKSIKGNTDIDAIIYDTATKSLGLFQLKWQDPFAHSMKERFSRISNLFPKAHEWIEKTKCWIENNKAPEILNALQITTVRPNEHEIKGIYLFIIARNNINFTGVKMDEAAAWASWQQLIEAHSQIAVMFDDPIRALYTKLKIFSPQNRIIMEDDVPEVEDFDFRFGNYRLFYKK